MDNRQRKELQDSLAAALLLIYQGSASEALVHLNATETELSISPQVRQRINEFASERAQLVQDGINQRLQAAASSDAANAITQARQGIDQHHETVLLPFLFRWASQQGLRDAYDATPAPDGSGRTATDATPWIWRQNTGYLDDCTAAAEASPAPRDELEAITGGPAPVHEGCQCDEYPAS